VIQDTNVHVMKKATKSQHTLYVKLIVTDKIMFCYKNRCCNEKNRREKSTNTKTKARQDNVPLRQHFLTGISFQYHVIPVTLVVHCNDCKFI